jgi:molybdopterin converting factor small subunit
MKARRRSFREATPVKVAVRYMAQLRRAAGTGVEPVELETPCSAAELLKRLAEQRGGAFRDLLLDADGSVRHAVLIFIGDEQVGAEIATLRDGDVVTVLTPMAGG